MANNNNPNLYKFKYMLQVSNVMHFVSENLWFNEKVYVIMRISIKMHKFYERSKTIKRT